MHVLSQRFIKANLPRNCLEARLGFAPRLSESESKVLLVTPSGYRLADRVGFEPTRQGFGGPSAPKLNDLLFGNHPRIIVPRILPEGDYCLAEGKVIETSTLLTMAGYSTPFWHLAATFYNLAEDVRIELTLGGSKPRRVRLSCPHQLSREPYEDPLVHLAESVGFEPTEQVSPLIKLAT